MTEIYFYHLQRQDLDGVLPRLVERSVARGWRALVRVASPERMAQLDDRLWSYSDESFLPHGSDRDPDASAHPILVTQGDGNPNGADILFVVDGAAVPDAIAGYQRVALVFDGRDAEALAEARTTWTRLKTQGHAVSYWQEGDDGRWQARG